MCVSIFRNYFLPPNTRTEEPNPQRCTPVHALSLTLFSLSCCSFAVADAPLAVIDFRGIGDAAASRHSLYCFPSSSRRAVRTGALLTIALSVLMEHQNTLRSQTYGLGRRRFSRSLWRPTGDWLVRALKFAQTSTSDTFNRSYRIDHSHTEFLVLALAAPVSCR